MVAVKGSRSLARMLPSENNGRGLYIRHTQHNNPSDDDALILYVDLQHRKASLLRVNWYRVLAQAMSVSIRTLTMHRIYLWVELGKSLLERYMLPCCIGSNV